MAGTSARTCSCTCTLADTVVAAAVAAGCYCRYPADYISPGQHALNLQAAEAAAATDDDNNAAAADGRVLDNLTLGAKNTLTAWAIFKGADERLGMVYDPDSRKFTLEWDPQPAEQQEQ